MWKGHGGVRGRCNGSGPRGRVHGHQHVRLTSRKWPWWRSLVRLFGARRPRAGTPSSALGPTAARSDRPPAREVTGLSPHAPGRCPPRDRPLARLPSFLGQRRQSCAPKPVPPINSPLRSPARVFGHAPHEFQPPSTKKTEGAQDRERARQRTRKTGDEENDGTGAFE